MNIQTMDLSLTPQLHSNAYDIFTSLMANIKSEINSDFSYMFAEKKYKELSQIIDNSAQGVFSASLSAFTTIQH
jgi:hypothetical protein